MARVVMSFALDSQKDRRILRYLEGLPRGEKSQAIRDALDAHLGGGGVTLGDVYQAVKDLERKLGSGSVLAQPGSVGDQSPTNPQTNRQTWQPISTVWVCDADRTSAVRDSRNQREGGEKRCCCDWLLFETKAGELLLGLVWKRRAGLAVVQAEWLASAAQRNAAGCQRRIEKRASGSRRFVGHRLAHQWAGRLAYHCNGRPAQLELYHGQEYSTRRSKQRWM